MDEITGEKRGQICLYCGVMVYIFRIGISGGDTYEK
jgi:hypothetical protein